MTQLTIPETADRGGDDGPYRHSIIAVDTGSEFAAYTVLAHSHDIRPSPQARDTAADDAYEYYGPPVNLRENETVGYLYTDEDGRFMDVELVL